MSNRPVYAFPRSDGQEGSKSGMALRDWFAGMAIAGVVGGSAGLSPISAAMYAEEAYRVADAMLAQRENCRRGCRG